MLHRTGTVWSKSSFEKLGTIFIKISRLRGFRSDTIYFTKERWEHILESRPELEPYHNKFLETLKTGRRKQDSLISNEYRYFKYFDELLPENTHLVAVVIFKTKIDERGGYIPNNFVVTGWAKFITPKG